MGKIIGIDLGSYFSTVSVMEGGQTIVIPNSEGSTSTSSIVSFDPKTGEIKVGDAAKRQAALNPKNTIFNIKRLMGRSYNDVKHLKRPYDIVDNNGKAAVKIGDKIYSPEEISAMILQKMKKTAEDYLGLEVKQCIITVPAYFNSDERKSTQVAGEIAGLEVLRIISEPTAASLNIKDKKGKLYFIVDSGGCTSDFSVMDIDDGIFEVIATDGSLDLGGNLIDEAIVNYVADDFKKEFGVDLRLDPMALQRLTESSEKAKIELSNTTQTEINLPYITVIDNVPKHLVKTINVAKFNQLIQFYIDKTLELIKSSLKKSGKNASDIDDIVLVGGSTRIPYLVESVEKFFGKKANRSLNADTAISQGACIQGSIIAGETSDILLLDVTALPFGIEVQGQLFQVMIEANTTIPVSKTQIFSTAQDNQPGVQINIATGERPMFKDNKHLGTFNLDGILPAMRGVPQIEVEFSLDANSILTVKAKDKATNKENKIRIEGSTALTKDEIEKMKMEAKENAESDKKEKEKIDTLNQADSLIFQTEKQITEFGEKLTETDKSELNAELNKLKESHKAQNLVDVEKYTKSLTDVWNNISTKIYSQSEQSEQSNQNCQNESTQSKNDDVTDVEFEEVK
jgi:molecular chaperone DnaK